MQPTARRVPFRVGLPGLSEHRTEDDDIVWSHILGNRAVVFRRLHVREHLLEGTVGKGVEQIRSGREVAVERPDADTCPTICPAS